MKRIGAFIPVCILLLSLLSGCAASPRMPKDDAYHPETDYPYPMQSYLPLQKFAESDEGFYFYAPSLMYYMDKNSMEPLPLCGKPECLHAAETEKARYEACNAYLMPFKMAGMAWYDGALYVIAPDSAQDRDAPAIQRISADGAERRTLWSFSRDTNVTQMLLHRGVLYMTMSSFTEDGRALTGLYAYTLSAPKKAPQLLLACEEKMAASQQGLNAYGRYVYIIRGTTEEYDTRELCIYDTQSGEVTTLGMQDELWSPLTVTFFGGKLLVSCQSIVPMDDDPEYPYPSRVYRCGLDGSDPECVWEGYGFFTADENYIYCEANVWRSGGEDHWLHILDGDFNELDRIDICELRGSGHTPSFICQPSRSGTVFISFWAAPPEGGSQCRYIFGFDRSEIGSGHIAVTPILDYLPR